MALPSAPVGRASLQPPSGVSARGVVHDFSRFQHRGLVSCSVSTERVEGIAEAIDAILAAGSFDGSRGAAKLCGQLQFSVCWSAYRFGRAALQPLYRAQGS